MTPPSPLLKNCPPEIQADPRPFDECSPEIPDLRPASRRFARFSLNWDHQLHLPTETNRNYRMGLGTVFRPIRQLGLGAQMDWNFKNELNAMGRIESSLNVDSHGFQQATLAGLVGINHLYGQTDVPGAPSQAVSGNRLLVGGELSFGWRLATFQNTTFQYLTFTPFLGLYYLKGSDLFLTDDKNMSVDVPDRVHGILGARISLDLFGVGSPIL